MRFSWHTNTGMRPNNRRLLHQKPTRILKPQTEPPQGSVVSGTTPGRTGAEGHLKEIDTNKVHFAMSHCCHH